MHLAMDATLLLLLLLIIYTTTIHLLHKLLNLPPTPFPSLPILGHLYLFSHAYLPLHRALSNISHRHGPLVYLHLGSRPALLVSSPSAARECFTRNDIIFANRPNLLNGKHFGYNFTSLAWSSYGPHWRNLRRISALQLLSSHRLSMLSSIQAEEAKSMVVKLLKENNNIGDPIDMRKLFFEHTYNVVTGMITCRKGRAGNSKEEAETFSEIVSEMSRVTLEANAADFLPVVRWLGLGKLVETKMTRLQEKRDKFMEDVMEGWQRGELEVEKEIDDRTGKKRSLLQVLMELQRAEPELYTDETIRNLLLVLIQGASHASSTTLEWAFARLLQNPHILARSRSEIDNLVGQHRLLTESDLPNLPYLRHIIDETLRMHPASPLLTPHVSSENCTVGGYRIPRGTILLVNVWDIQNNPAGTWKDPDKFTPERFEQGAGEKLEYEYGPFGWGRRACPGEKLAQEMMGLALGSLIQCFEWEKAKEEEEEEEEGEMREGRGIITPRFHPLRAVCIPRPFGSLHLLS